MLEQGRPNDGRSGRCGIRVSSHHWCTLDDGHPGEHSTDEHPDTIALRKCREELAESKTTVLANQQAADREYKRRVQAESERDTALKQLAHTEDLLAGCSQSVDTWQQMHATVEAERDARVAELEAADKRRLAAEQRVAELEAEVDHDKALDVIAEMLGVER